MLYIDFQIDIYNDFKLIDKFISIVMYMFEMYEELKY